MKTGLLIYWLNIETGKTDHSVVLTKPSTTLPEAIQKCREKIPAILNMELIEIHELDTMPNMMPDMTPKITEK